ncbi:CBAR2-like protein [Mya arenaria]|uniref:CBAR2-like protein n=1 Tax=Mya arenaria TaxID=6604 RepID=A0ABY7EW70_MYAAR|nr:CBAR2-like protein [Mya arenaria]
MASSSRSQLFAVGSGGGGDGGGIDTMSSTTSLPADMKELHAFGKQVENSCKSISDFDSESDISTSISGKQLAGLNKTESKYDQHNQCTKGLESKRVDEALQMRRKMGKHTVEKDNVSEFSDLSSISGTTSQSGRRRKTNKSRAQTDLGSENGKPHSREKGRETTPDGNDTSYSDMSACSAGSEKKKKRKNKVKIITEEEVVRDLEEKTKKKISFNSNIKEIEEEEEEASGSRGAAGEHVEDNTEDASNLDSNDVSDKHEDSLTKEDSGLIPLENQVKFCQERATVVEKSYGSFCDTLASITRKIARMRDKGDLLSKQVLEFAEKEKISVSTSKHMKDFARNLATIQDYREAEIHRLESKVIKPLSSYGGRCKTIKQVIKREQGAIAREVKQRKNLDKVRSKKTGDNHAIAETELMKAQTDASIGSQALAKQMREFEKEKLHDLKHVLADFVSVEMVFHTKAIEYYSQCFDSLASIDEEDDLEEFSRKLNLTQGHSSTVALPEDMQVPEGTIGSMGSTFLSTTGLQSSEYTSTGDSYTYTYGDSTMSTGEKRVRIQTVGKSAMYQGVDDDDDDDDDDDEDDDDEDDEN